MRTIRKPDLIVLVIAALAGQPVSAQTSCDIASMQAMTPATLSQAMARYKTISLAKDEFETTAAYNARVAAARQSLPSGDILVSIPESGLTKFDADSSTITVSAYALSGTCLVSDYTLSAEMKAVKFGEQSRYGIGSAYCLTKVVKSDGEGTYEATNGFGAKVTVEKSHLLSEGLFFGMGDFGQPLLAGRRKYSSDPIFSFKASAEEARSLKDNAEIAVLVSPIAPFTGSGSYYSKPTFERPTETVFKTDFLVVTPVCFGLRDGKSGKIFAVASPNSFK